ncbi:anthranilate synthase component I [Aeribacillus pallidus]|uniref:anthranilate synthase component I n=1 Tax=Aeribacillus pallidus TaxID=33936 RepID=UPI003D1A5B42
MEPSFTSFVKDAQRYRTIPIIQTFYADLFTPIHMFQKLQHDAAYILESKDEYSPWSRYSFIGLNPMMKITEKDGHLLIVDTIMKNRFKVSSLQKAIQRVSDWLQIKIPKTSLPFIGGAVGYIGYDAVSTFEKIPPHPQNDLHMPMYQFVYAETVIAFCHQTKELTVIQWVRLKGDETERALKERYDHGINMINQVAMQLQHPSTFPAFLLPHQTIEIDWGIVTSNYNRDVFLSHVNKVKQYITSGDIFQGVISQRFAVPVKTSGFDLYRYLRIINPSPYLFYLPFADVEIVGSSPERLLLVEGHHVEIHPIAGTRRRGKTKSEDERLANDLTNDEKEQAEHYMLVDLARNDIGRIAEYGSVRVPMLMELKRFSHVMHLVSKVTGTLRSDVHPIEALLASFPAGTVSGAPKFRAMEIIRELEPTARNLYAGAITYIGFDGNIDSCIAIRTIVVKNGTAYVQAGAGIVSDSKPELEWKETRNKASALIRTITYANTISLKEETYQ